MEEWARPMGGGRAPAGSDPHLCRPPSRELGPAEHQERSHGQGWELTPRLHLSGSLAIGGNPLRPSYDTVDLVPSGSLISRWIHPSGTYHVSSKNTKMLLLH
jgi:hypothetical protein